MYVCVCVCVYCHSYPAAKRMRRIMLSCVARVAVPYFSTSAHERHEFLAKVTEYKMCCFDFFLQPLSETFLIVRRIYRDVINVHKCSSEVPVILVRFYWNSSFEDRFPTNPQIPNYMEIRRVGAMLFHADRQTDRQTCTKKLTAALRNISNAPENKVKVV